MASGNSRDEEPLPLDALPRPAPPGAVGLGETTPPRDFGPTERTAVLVGAAIAVVVLLVPFLRFVFGTLGTLVHELGHSAVAWLFGIPAIPSFDFVHGGGWSLQGRRSVVLQLAWLAALGWLGFRVRAHRNALAVVLGVGLAWAALAATFLHEVAITAAGHAGELAFAAIFLHRGLTGAGCRLPVERPLSIFVGLFLEARVVLFAWGVAFDAGTRDYYETGKGGVLHDLHDVALTLHGRIGWALGTDGAATLLLLACALPPALAWLAFRHGPALRERATAWLAA